MMPLLHAKPSVDGWARAPATAGAPVAKQLLSSLSVFPRRSAGLHLGIHSSLTFPHSHYFPSTSFASPAWDHAHFSGPFRCVFARKLLQDPEAETDPLSRKPEIAKYSGLSSTSHVLLIP